MRVLHIASTWARGGIASSLWHLLPEVKAAGVDVEIVGLNELGTYGERLQKHSIPGSSLDFETKYDWRAFSRLVKQLQREHFDLVHAHGWPAIFFIAIAARFVPGSRYFVTEHSVSNRRRRYHLRFLERWIYRRYASIISVSRAADNALHDWLPETANRSRVIYNGISLERLNEPFAEPSGANDFQDSSPLILFAGGSEYHKGADILIDALTLLRDKSDLVLALAGAGRHDGDLLARIRGAGLEARIRWLGYVPDIVTRMREADVFVLPSRREGCPMVVLEAMAVGLPTVAAGVGGVPELIRDRNTGLVVPPEDPAALARGICTMLGNRGLARELGARAQERVKDFSAQEQASRLLTLYLGDTEFEHERP